jgi:multidrug efflux pump subunit AcrA (membrane-fusion protein)
MMPLPSGRLRRLLSWLPLLLALPACSRHDTGDDAESPAPAAEVRVRVATLAERAFTPTIDAAGHWRSRGEIVLAAPFAAYIDTLPIEVGDVVSRGRVVARLTTRESRAALIGAREMLAAAGDPAARAEAERALAAAEHGLVHVALPASQSGTVIRRSSGTGAEVAEGAELVALIPGPGLVFEAHVPLADAARVGAGTRAVIDGEDGTSIVARALRRMPETSHDDQTALWWLEPATPVATAWNDRFGTAHLALGASHRALAVPDSAVVEDDLTGVTRIATITPAGTAVWVTVRLGAAAAGWHELLAPALGPGTRVLTSGQRGLADSTHVTVTP